ncbi:DUF3422 family protein [Neptuniibacter halophilus]|uniref:DUF3422 family protein n=1 Tax=Neptuniibacter halophilus TaxID=651666 RepID=UPI0025733A06|nr:DUF3422 domain-containing protein [Neptuniibacter halophilus]
MQNHPLRQQISTEVHARPFQKLEPELGLLHIAASYGQGGREALAEAVGRLLRQMDINCPPSLTKFFFTRNQHLALRYEPHNEFYTLTLYQLDKADTRYLKTLWQQLPGEFLCGVEILFSKHRGATPDLLQQFDDRQVSGSFVMGRAAKVWTDFCPRGEDGFVRMIVHDDSLKSFQAGRLLQRLCEIETYRHTALLALPIAQNSMPRLTEMDRELAEITHQISVSPNEPDLLKKLMNLAAQVEELSADTANRFSASQAYFALLESRIDELREERIEGLQTLDQFMERRLDPAKRTCLAANDRIERLSRRIARATDLIRSQVDLSIEKQNQQLLEGLNNRSRRQLRLQAKLESFTIIVVTYYAFDLLERSIRNMVPGDEMRDQYLMWVSFSVPLIAGVLWWYVRRLLKHYSED